MKINDAVARIVRAGDENSAMWQKIHEAIDELAKTLARYFPDGGIMKQVAHCGTVGVWFRHWANGGYEITMGRANPYQYLRRDYKSREAVLEFCRLVTQNGLLDKISEQLEEETSGLSKGCEAIAVLQQQILDRADWDHMIKEVGALIERLRFKPKKRKFNFSPSSILSAYREGDLPIEEAVEALKIWKTLPPGSL